MKTPKKKLILLKTLLLAALGLHASLFLSAPLAMDNPHNNVNNCATCHTPAADPSWWTDQGTSGGLCGQCHYPGSANGDAVTHIATDKYGNVEQICTNCHNPHYQKQFRVWKTSSYLTTGTISAVNSSTMTRSGTSPGWVPDQWKGMVLIPDIRYLLYNYRIESNTSSVITIDTSHGDSIKLAYAAPGATFAISYGGLIKESIGGFPVKFYRDTGINSFADGDGTRDGVCEVCHTRTMHFRMSGVAPDQLHTSIGSSAAGTRCIACHKHTVGFTGANAGCLGCHDGPIGSRTAVGSRFQANSHHVQGGTLANKHCYHCHWEANDDGSINTSYHGGSSMPGSAIDLVIYGAGARPTSYTIDTTAIQYTANGTRAEINKITTHCLGCHSDQNNATQPFAPEDTRTPKQYAWDESSVANRYNQAGVVPWGKYSGANVTPKSSVQKAYSAHGNAVGNQGGWNLAETWPNTRNGSVNIQCFDCHNSHGSAAAGKTSSYTSATASGGILKETSANQGGYTMTYVPGEGGSADTKNFRNSGASLCLDCHLTQTEGTATPWGYGSTFGANQQILGYWDTPYFGPGTFGSQQRYSYKASSSHRGGHFGASAPVPGATGTIDGLCTPCHDPHGVTNNTAKIALADKPYAVPLLKGTWLTSPYKEDVAPANNATGSINDVNAGNAYHIDQNTFGTDIIVPVAGITQTDNQFAGLCLICHPKNSLTDGSNGGTWRSVDRIHESVKGWGANGKHNYSCSKCHTPHNSRLPRLMVANCLNTRHKGRVGGTASPILSGSAYNCGLYPYSGGPQCGGGEGWFPGAHGGGGGYDPSISNPTYNVSCHENQTGNLTDQSWNDRTPWSNMSPSVPTLIDEPNTLATSVQLQWNASTDPEGDPIQYYVQVDDASNFSSPNYSSGWISGTSYSLTVGNNTTWYWRVKAKDAMTESGWSATDSFIVSDGNAPPQVTLAAPANGTPYNNYPVNVYLQWNAVPPFAQYRVVVDNEPGFSTPLVYDSGWIDATSQTVSITTAGAYYWRVQARDTLSLATGAVSETWNFMTNSAPSVPVLIAEPDTTSTSIQLQWNASTDPEGHNPVLYYAQVDDDPYFGSPNFGGTWQSGTSLSFTVGTNTTWSWRVKAKDSWNKESAWSSTDTFLVSDGAAPPQVTLVGPANGTTVSSDFSFQWNAAPPCAEYLVQYSADPTFNTGVVSSGWTASTGWAPAPGPGTYYWRVQARDSVSQATGPWSSEPYWSFTITDSCYGDSCCLYGCATCPTLYSWDGTMYQFETDTFPTGYLGTKTATGFRKPNPYEYHLLESTPQLLGGYYSLKIVEERDEQDYFDTLKLYTVDYSSNRDIYQELRTAGIYAEPASMIHTVAKTLQRPVSIKHVNTGQDVAAKLAYSDKDYLVLNTDRNVDYNWQTLEFDLGDQSLAPQIKLIIDAEMVVPTTSAGMARKLLLSPNGKITRLEILDAGGNWTLVPYSVKEIFSPKERSSAYIVDITNIFTTGTYKFRLSFLYKVYVDAIFFDTTVDLPVTLTELPLVSANLRYYGFSEMTEGELFDYIYGSLVTRDASYFTGNYTKYGDVTPLLTRTDDKLVIFSGGEEIDVRFGADSQPPPAGKARRYLVYANGYYKATGNVDIPHTVKPLPFAAMSNFPYDPAVEHYPDDAEHQQYQLEYNTRVK